MASSTVTMDDRCSSPIRPSAIRILLWSFAIRESAHPPQPLFVPSKSVPGYCEASTSFLGMPRRDAEHHVAGRVCHQVFGCRAKYYLT